MTIDLEGDIKSCCATEDGIKEFFDKKMSDFEANNEKEEDGENGDDYWLSVN